jgi:transposase
MPVHKYHVHLTPDERKLLETSLSDGALDRRTRTHIQVLLLADERPGEKKMSEQAIATVVGINSQTVHMIRRRYAEEGLAAAIIRKSRYSAPKNSRINPDVRTRIIALSQSSPPAGKSRWTLRLLAHHAREQHIVDHISHETVNQVLKGARQQSII